MDTNKVEIAPVHCISEKSLAYSSLVSSVAKHIKDSEDLWPAYLAFCNVKGFDPEDYLPKYSVHQVENSCADTSTEEDKDGNTEIYGPFNLDDALFAARVNLLGCPNITNYIESQILGGYKTRTHFYVEVGRLNAIVELVGGKGFIEEGVYLRRIRHILRTFGFGDIETIEENTAEEPNGNVSIPTLASRSLP